ncbi:hypothetical protein BJX61DRAFT_390824 [Aspergillus egyptiacus]|nr:hypothetical protein BJX61DRAFT_390824 [Aspergillus egyptiacus]
MGIHPRLLENIRTSSARDRTRDAGRNRPGRFPISHLSVARSFAVRMILCGPFPRQPSPVQGFNWVLSRRHKNGLILFLPSPLQETPKQEAEIGRDVPFPGFCNLHADALDSNLLMAGCGMRPARPAPRADNVTSLELYSRTITAVGNVIVPWYRPAILDKLIQLSGINLLLVDSSSIEYAKVDQTVDLFLGLARSSSHNSCITLHPIQPSKGFDLPLTIRVGVQ